MKCTKLAAGFLCWTLVLLVFALHPQAAGAEESGWFQLQPCLPVWETVPVASVPRMAAGKAGNPPVIDGQLTDANWKGLPDNTAFSTCRNFPESALTWVSAACQYDGERLYLAARLQKAEGNLKASCKTPGGRIWEDDCLEIFLGQPDSAVRYQIDVNANGVWWAGAVGGGKDWKPDIRAAGKIEDKTWTVELSIPLASLDLDKGNLLPLAMDMRYLVNNGASWTAWGSGQGAKQGYGILILDPAKAPLLPAQTTAFLMPDALLRGKNSEVLGVEVVNSDKVPHQIAVLLDWGTNFGKHVQEILQLQPKEKKRFMLNLDIAGADLQNIPLRLTCKDLTGAQTIFAKEKTVPVIPEFSFVLDRMRLLKGDRETTGILSYGTNLGEMFMELWDDVHCINREKLTIKNPGQYRIRLKTASLNPGEYRFRIKTGTAGHILTETVPLVIVQTVPMPESSKIALITDVGTVQPGGKEEDVPLYSGITFPGGVLTDMKQVRVVDDSGREVPSQSEILTTWGPGGSIQWLGMHFQGKTGRTYAAEFGSDVQRKVLPEKPVTVNPAAGGNGLTIDTGAAVFELSKTGPLIVKSSLGGIPVTTNSKGCLTVTDQKGRIGDETHDTVSDGVGPQVEFSGPLMAVVRREGFYRTEKGESLGKYVVRLSFYAGKPYVGIQHTFIHTEDSNRQQIADLSLSFLPVFSAPWKVVLNNLPGKDNGNFSTEIEPAKGEGAYLAQTEYRHYLSELCEYQVGVKKAAGDWKTVNKGERAGNWGAVTGKDTGVALILPKLVEMFPKEIEVGADGIAAHLWSSRGGRLLDYRPSAISKNLGEEWVEKGGYPGGLKAFNAIYSTAVGSARTHDLMLMLMKTGEGTGQVSATAERAENPPITIQDPAWLNQTGAIGPIHQHDPKKFPRIESFVQNTFLTEVAGKADKIGDYGFLEYGNGPHSYVGRPQYKHFPRFYRYYDTDYQFRNAVWLLFARSGYRPYFTYGYHYNRHLSDFLYSYWSSQGKPKGTLLMAGDSMWPLYWLNSASFYGSQGITMSGPLMMHYLTGDRRIMDGVRAYADYMARNFDPSKLPDAIAGSNQAPYECLAELYAATWDERLGDLLRETRMRITDLETGSGLPNDKYYGAWYKPFTVINAVLKDWIVTGSPRAKECFLKYCQTLLRKVPPSDPGYNDFTGKFMNYAWQMTGDQRYADWNAERLSRVEKAFTAPDGRVTVANPFVGTHNLTFYETVARGLDLVAKNEGKIRPWPQLETGPSGFPVSMFIQKPHGKTVSADLDYGRKFNLVMTKIQREKDVPLKYGYLGSVELNSCPSYGLDEDNGGLGRGFATLLLPKETLAGEYRLDDVRRIYATDAEKLVLCIPCGAYLPASNTQGTTWYFSVPAGREGALQVNKPVTMNFDGKEVAIQAGAAYPIAKSDKERKGIIRVNEMTFLRFSGNIPAVLSCNDAGGYFVPDSPNATPNPLLPLEPADSVWTPGQTKQEGDQALLLNGKRSLILPRGEKKDSGRRNYQFVDYDKGTLEFWFKPQWTSPLLTEKKTFPIIKCMEWELSYFNYLGNTVDGKEFPFVDNQFLFRALSPDKKPPYVPQDIRNHMSIEQGDWHHLALCWEYDTGKKVWNAELYIDGRSEHGGLHRYEYAPKLGYNWDVAEPSRPFEFPGGFNAVIDEIRISDIPRYSVSFDPIPRRPFETDKHTRLLLHMNGNAKAVDGEGKPVETQVSGIPNK